jgi:hypothetical protein
MKKYIITLKEEERNQLKEVITKGKSEAYQIRHAHILLQADTDGPAWSDESIAKVFAVHTNTVAMVRKRFIKRGLETAIKRKPQDYPSYSPRFDGEAEARLIALSCGQPPEGYSRWTLRLLASKVVELEIVDKVCPETVRQTLKKRAKAPFA